MLHATICAVLLLVLLTHTHVLVPPSTAIMSLSDLLPCVKVAGLCSSDLPFLPFLHHSSASNCQSCSWD